MRATPLGEGWKVESGRWKVEGEEVRGEEQAEGELRFFFLFRFEPMRILARV